MKYYTIRAPCRRKPPARAAEPLGCMLCLCLFRRLFYVCSFINICICMYVLCLLLDLWDLCVLC